MIPEEKLKVISKSFNSSNNFEEFIAKLNSNGLSIDDAQKIYSQLNANLLKYCKDWCTLNMIDFKKIFNELDYMSIVLPYALRKEVEPDTFKTKLNMKTLLPNGKERIQTANFELISEINEKYNINIENEIICDMLDQLSEYCFNERKNGIWHGKI